MNRLTAFVAITVFSFASACSTASSSASGADEQPVLDGVAANVILPSLRDLDSKMGELSLKLASFAWDPNEANLAAAQNAWKETRIAYRHTEAFRFGPAESKRLTPLIDYFPANVTSIEALVAD